MPTDAEIAQSLARARETIAKLAAIPPDWQLVFRRVGAGAEVEVWSVADQRWRTTGLLQLLKDADRAMVAIDSDLAEQWLAHKPVFNGVTQPTASEYAEAEARAYKLIAERAAATSTELEP